MREFSAEYLRRTREGMWADGREALADLDLDSRTRVLDVGCGTGELTRVLAEESDATVVGVDADPGLLAVARERAETGRPSPDAERPAFVGGDATRLPFPDDAVDLVVCQALLINLPDPLAAVREFARVSSELVAAVEPDNAAVSVASTVDAEPALDRRARDAYIGGVETDVALGGEGTRELFDAVDLAAVRTRRYDHDRTVEPPYSEGALADARRKASGEGLADRRATMLSGRLTEPEYEALRADWRAMGRSVVGQMQDDEYRREEIVPFFVTVGRV